MKTKKLMRRLKAIFSADLREQQNEADALRKLLGKLKKKEKKLIAKLERVSNTEERQGLKKKIQLLHGQRKKGLKLLKNG